MTRRTVMPGGLLFWERKELFSAISRDSEEYLLQER